MNSKENVLIVDDDPNNIYFLNEILSEYYRTTVADSGKRALELAKEHIPDIILLDVAMPLMNGYEVCQKLKADKTLHDIPVIFLSAIDSTANKVKGFEVGGVDYVTKPFNIAEILERVKTHLGLKQARQALQEQNEKLEAEILSRQVIEEQLRQSEEKYRLLFERTNDAVLIIGMDLKHLEVNHQAAYLLGYPLEDLINKHISNFVIADESETSLDLAMRMINGDVLPPYEREFRRKDGTTFLAEVNVSLIHDDDGQPLYFHSIIRDITEKKKLQQALKESERRYRGILENTGEAVFATDINGNFTYVNQVMVKRSDMTEDDLIGTHFTALVDEEWQAKVSKFYIEQLKDKVEETVYIFPLRKVGNEKTWVEQTINFIMDGEKITGFLGIARDITERRRIEAEREQLIAELDAFAHTVAHDLKNPLGALKLYGGLFESRYDLMLPQKHKELLVSMNAVTEKMNKIVDALLLLSSVRKKSDITREILNMSEIVTEAEERLIQQIKTCKAEYTITDNFPASIGYAPWIEEVWVNYLSNAMKYGGEPVKFEIGANIIDEESVRFWVKDNGNGISLEDQDKLFTPFTRLDTGTAEGHGLGLSIVQRITEKLNGHVGIESELGKGSTFYFVLPRHMT